jgi:predicted phosphodiesterase
VKLRVAHVSDLHFEFGEPPPTIDANSCDLIVATGDIDVGENAKDWLARQGQPTIYVPGNHEYYHHEMAYLRGQFRMWGLPNVHVLDPGTYEAETKDYKVRVIGATLWTDYAMFGAANKETAKHQAVRALADHRLIRLRGAPFIPDYAEEAHRQERGYLADALAWPFDGITIVATHHAPTPRAIDPRYYGRVTAGDYVSAAFASDLEYMMPGVDLWLYGHTHGCLDVKVGDCRVFSNQRGYPGEIPGFEPRVIEVSK